MIEQSTLYTERLVLRTISCEDVARLEELAWTREVIDTTIHLFKKDEALAWVSSYPSLYGAGKVVVYGIALSVANELIGCVDLAINRLHRRATLGYWIGHQFWGHGYATEAAQSVLDYAFGPLEMNGVIAAHFTRNAASGRVLQKLGMTPEGTRRGFYLKDGVFEDMDTYWMLACEWHKPVLRQHIALTEPTT